MQRSAVHFSHQHLMVDLRCFKKWLKLDSKNNTTLTLEYLNMRNNTVDIETNISSNMLNISKQIRIAKATY